MNGEEIKHIHLIAPDENLIVTEVHIFLNFYLLFNRERRLAIIFLETITRHPSRTQGVMR